MSDADIHASDLTGAFPITGRNPNDPATTCDVLAEGWERHAAELERDALAEQVKQLRAELDRCHPEAYLDGVAAGRREAAEEIRREARKYIGSQFQNFEMCARIAERQK